MLKKINPVRFIALAAFIILLLGVFCSLYFTDTNVHKSVVPYPTITIPVINIFSAFFALLLFIFPSHKIFMYFVLIPQIISTTLTTHETLGAFLYVLLIVIIYFNDTLSIKAKKIIIISSLSVWLFTLLGCYVYGIVHFVMDYAETLFFLCVIISLKLFYEEKFQTIMPLLNSNLYLSKNINLPNIGEDISLSEYNLSKRQSDFLISFIVNNLSYNQIASKFNCSLSLVKKEMSCCLEIFGCKNISTLKMILCHYKLKY